MLKLLRIPKRNLFGSERVNRANSHIENIPPGQSMRLKFSWTCQPFVLFCFAVPRSQDVGEDHSPECIVKRIRSLLEACRVVRKFKTCHERRLARERLDGLVRFV